MKRLGPLSVATAVFGMSFLPLACVDQAQNQGSRAAALL